MSLCDVLCFLSVLLPMDGYYGCDSDPLICLGGFCWYVGDPLTLVSPSDWPKWMLKSSPPSLGFCAPSPLDNGYHSGLRYGEVH